MPKRFSTSVRIFYPKYDQETIIQKLRNRIEALRKDLPISLVVLFGSYASNRHTVRSDVDVLIIHKSEFSDVFEIVKKAIGLSGIEPHIYSEAEYLKMKAIIDRMIENGVVIFKE